MSNEFEGISNIIKEVDIILNSKISKGVDQQLRDFRRFILNDKNFEKNSYEYIRSINWYQNEINKKLLKAYYTNEKNKKNEEKIAELLNKLRCRIDQFLTHREVWHKDSKDLELILNDSYSKILNKCKEVIDLPDFLFK